MGFNLRVHHVNGHPESFQMVRLTAPGINSTYSQPHGFGDQERNHEKHGYSEYQFKKGKSLLV
jgi:hypothetical protein